MLSYLRRRRTLVLTGWIVAAGGIVIFETVRLGTSHFGYQRNDVALGVPRVIFSYVIGCVLQRAFVASDWSYLRRWFPLAVVALIGVVCLPVRDGNDLISLPIIVLVMPAILLISATYSPNGLIKTVASVLGNASYAIYILHFPMGMLFDQLWKRTAARHLPTVPLAGLVLLPLVIFVSVLATDFYDVPVRKWLRGKLLRR